MADIRLLTPEDAQAIQVVSDAHITPDGSQVAFVLSDSFKEDHHFPNSRIWLVPTAGGEAYAFSSGPHSDLAPRWSPDGQGLAFLSNRQDDARHQLYIWRSGAGEAQPLTDQAGDVYAPAWSPDGSRIAFLMLDVETEAEKKRKAEKDDAIEVEAQPKFARLWTVDVATRQTHQLTHGDVHVWEFAWSPDGQRFAVVLSDLPYDYSWYHPRLAVLAAEGGDPTTVCAPLDPAHAAWHHQLAHLMWSPDGQTLAFIMGTWSDRPLTFGDLYVVPATGGSPRNLTQDQPVSFTYAEWQVGGHSLLFAGIAAGEQVLGTITLDPPAVAVQWRAPVAWAERNQPRFSRAANGALAVIQDDTSHPRDIWYSPTSSEGPLHWQQVTHLHPQIAAFILARFDTLHWQGRDGLPIQGLLARPAGIAEGTRLPLVVWVHGGPTHLYMHSLYGGGGSTALPQLLAASGFAVLLPNPRGSTGFGRRYAEANLGGMGAEDLYDILAGVDYCVENGIADPERLAIGGWSYGGFMTLWAIGQTTRFKAAVAGAGISNWRSFHGQSSLHTWDLRYAQADPLQLGGYYDQFSPLTYIGQVTTPVLILHGEKDVDVPVGQSYEFYRALRERDKTVQLVVYPREPHGFRERRHELDLQRRMVGWFERWLK